NVLTGVQVDVGCLNNTIKNNIIHTAASHCLFAHPTATGSVEDYNICYNSGSTNGFSGGTHDKTTDPLFVTTPPTIAAHFKLQSASPAIDAGVALGAPYATAAFNATGLTFPFSTRDQTTAGIAWEIGAFMWAPVAGGTVVV